MGEKLNLTWHTFLPHGQDLFKNLFETQEFSDVALVSDDQHEYKVHKFVLSASSTVFKKILTRNPLNTSIYLKGINHEDLEPILQFIYLGVATFYHERINDFLNAAKHLGIKNISDNVVDEAINPSHFSEENLVEEGEAENNLGIDEKIPASSKKETHFLNDSLQDSFTLCEKKLYKCQQCDFEATLMGSLTRHIMSKHELRKYPCQKCDYQAPRYDSLQRHMRAIHEGLKHPCQQCDYKANCPSNLSHHKKRYH